MAVKVMIKRRVPVGTEQLLVPLLKELRTLAWKQPGYISGETYQRVDRPGVSLVVSMWQSEEDWEKWMSSEGRADIQQRIDSLVKTETKYEVIPGK